MNADEISRKDRQARKERISFAVFAPFACYVVVPLVFLACHLPYLPQSLEDLDSINFALGVRHFDVAEHQPHPPGYPLFILIAKAFDAVIPAEALALSAVSIAAGTLGVLAIAGLFRRINVDATRFEWIAATLVAITAPMYWFTAGRPLSDMAGLGAALGLQWMTLAARTRRMLYAAAFCAALAAGVRSQVVWLTAPLIVFRLAQNLHHGGHGGRGGQNTSVPDFFSVSPVPSVVKIVATAAAYAAGILAWFVPLVMLSGGPAAYWRALTFQGSADFGDVRMLWTRHGARDVADALYYTFVAPWATWPAAVVVLVLAALGFTWCTVRARPAVWRLMIAFGPYLVFHLLFQETFTSRYALPLVIPTALLAAAGARVIPWRLGVAAIVALVMFDAHAAGTSLAAYAGAKAPAFRLLDDMASAARSAPAPPVLAMDRGQSFDFRRPIAWTRDMLPRFAATLPAPPQHEWLEAVKYWTGGGRAPVWFVVDPKRTIIDLVQHGAPSEYRWPLAHPVLVSGARPSEMDWYRVDRPEWFVGEGWALTPEAAGVAEEVDRAGPAFRPIDAWIARAVSGGFIVIGGRNFGPRAQPRLTLSVGGAAPQEFTLAPGPFLTFASVPAANGDAASADYVKVTVAVLPPARLAIEQFDASALRAIFGFGEGWHEQEFNPRTGRRWRWLSERGELRFASSTPRLLLHLEGESPRTYFSRGSRLIVRAGDTVTFDDVLTSDFALNIPLPNGTRTVTLETDQVWVPAERGWRRTADRRHLGLRIFKCEVRRVS